MSLSVPRIPILITGDQNVTKIQQNINQAFSSFSANLNQSPFATGVAIYNVPLTAGTPNVVAHTLGYLPTGYIVTSVNANSNVWISAKTTQSLTLNVITGCIASLWVF